MNPFARFARRFRADAALGRSVALLKAGVGIAILASSAANAQDVAQWRDPALGPDVRAQRVLAAMTLDEKIAMVSGTFGSKVRKANPADQRVGAGHVFGVPRLGIPDLYETDASLGVANSGSMRPGDVATALPSGLALAASFDPAMAYTTGAMIGSEARAKGFNILLAGGANLIRDPWNGRNFEYLSEDTLLTGVMAGESIRGVQSNKIVSTLKHFALNAQESGRYVLDARLSDAALQESDLLAFRIAIERGAPGSVMCGYNKVNSDWACENSPLLNDVLKRDWKFPGWVMSDWGAVHSTAKAANAGLDQQSGRDMDTAPFFVAPLKAAVEGGSVPAARLDDMVRRILRTMFAHGLVDTPTPATPQPIDYKAHAEIAQRAAEGGIVLLKNEGGLLPLARTAQRILVIGAHADIGVVSGGGSSQVQAVSGSPIRMPMPNAGPGLGFIKVTYHGSSPLAALRAQAPKAAISYIDSSDPATVAAAAKNADLVLFFAEQWRTEAVDLTSLSLSDGQDALISAAAAANPRTVVVMQSGGPVLMPWIGQVGAVVEAWYPGERGGEAIARVLFGDVDATGRLPVTFPQTAGQAPRPEVPGLAQVRAAAAKRTNAKPIAGATTVGLDGGVESFPVEYREGADVGYRWYQRQGAKPLFPFGFGLSYTRFAYRGLETPAGTPMHVRFTVSNVGARAGSDVPQVYASVKGDDGKPIRRLIGFERVTLAPGESRTVEVKVDPRLIGSFDTARRAWQAPGGPVTIEVGHDAATIELTHVAR